MIRELDRYLVLKWDDIYKYLSEDQRYALEKMLSRIVVKRIRDNKIGEPKYVCIQESWPEYEPVWQMLEKRIDSENSIHS